MVFTPNKNLEQPARGSNVGVWDTPVNSNTGIIDNSFGGVTTIPLVNTPITLSPAQYQCVFIVLTGAISANIPITLPAVGSFYTIQNLTSNTSAFYVTMLTTAAGGQAIGIPPGESCDIFTDGVNVKYRDLGRIGSYWDYAGSSVPAWVSACSVPPYLYCNGSAFSSATFPILATILGGVTLPDFRGRGGIYLNDGTNRITSSGGVDGNTPYAAGGAQSITLSTQNIPNYNLPIVDPGHFHSGVPGSVFGPHTASFVTGADYNIGTTGQTAFTGITVPSGGGGIGFGIVQPSVVSGIRMIRSA